MLCTKEYLLTTTLRGTSSDAPDRHVMRIAKRPTADEPWDTLIVAHEMGHIMGLLHEVRDLLIRNMCEPSTDRGFLPTASATRP